MKRAWLGILLFLILALGILVSMVSNSYDSNENSQSQPGEIKYIPIGDSYTIGNGVAVNDRWPNVMVRHLNEAGIKIRLVENPAVSGFTVADAIQYEIPRIKQLQPDFVTVFIGANDSFRGGEVGQYESELNELLDLVEGSLADKDKILLITIPDFTSTPAAEDYDAGSKLQDRQLIQNYNRVIQQIADERGLKVADLFPLSQTMTGAEDYIYDGLHPSAQGYRKWEAVIYPVAEQVLKD